MTMVKGYISTENILVLSRQEAIDKYMGICAAYFNSIGNCMLDVNVQNLRNVALFYSTVRKLSPCGLCQGGCVTNVDKWNLNRADAVWEHIHLNNNSPEFMRVETSKFAHRLCDNSYLITIKKTDKGENYNRVVGEFCPQRKILLATDWTNDDTRISFVSDILSSMEKNGLISKRTVEKIRPSLMYGADPELELVDSDTDEIISCKEAGIPDKIMISGRDEGRIGHDGAGSQRELRPEPSSTPEGLVKNIEYLIIRNSIIN